MNEVLTLEEMKSRYDGEWVLVENPEVDEQMRVIRGSVISHSADRDEMDRDMSRLRPKHSAGQVRLTTARGVEFAPRLALSKFETLGQARVGYAVLALTLPPSANIDGLLGLDFIRGQELSINYRTGQITLL